MSETPGRLDAVVLAGGGSRRLGGVAKAQLVLEGERLVDRVVAAAVGAGARCVVVGPADLGTSVPTTHESPPGGGPVAGIAAGLAALVPGAPEVLVLACDLVGPERVVAALRAADLDDVDGACLVEIGGRAQWLAGRYRREALDAALVRLESGGHDAGAGRSVRDLVRSLTLGPVPVAATTVADIDTWADARAAGARDPASGAVHGHGRARPADLG